MRRVIPIMLVTATIGGAAVLAWGTAPARAETMANWPCNNPYKEALSAEDIWGGPPPAAKGGWREAAGPREVVLFATNPEINPERGRAAIAEFAAKAGPDRGPELALVFQGMVEEINSYHRILIAGIGNYTVKAMILKESVDKSDAEIAALPDDADEARRDIRLARMWDFRNMDDAEEEADFLCRRLAYLEEKLRRLTDQVRTEMAAP